MEVIYFSLKLSFYYVPDYMMTGIYGAKADQWVKQLKVGGTSYMASAQLLQSPSRRK